MTQLHESTLQIRPQPFFVHKGEQSRIRKAWIGAQQTSNPMRTLHDDLDGRFSYTFLEEVVGRWPRTPIKTSPSLSPPPLPRPPTPVPPPPPPPSPTGPSDGPVPANPPIQAFQSVDRSEMIERAVSKCREGGQHKEVGAHWCRKCWLYKPDRILRKCEFAKPTALALEKTEDGAVRSTKDPARRHKLLNRAYDPWANA